MGSLELRASAGCNDWTSGMVRAVPLRTGIDSAKIYDVFLSSLCVELSYLMHMHSVTMQINSSPREDDAEVEKPMAHI